MSTPSIITTEALAARLAEPQPFFFWNVLTDAYFKGALIPGSLRLPADRIGRDAERLGLPKSAEIVVYCAGPSCPQSRQAADKLVALGYTNVSAYEGGVEEWVKAGHAVVRVEQRAAA